MFLLRASELGKEGKTEMWEYVLKSSHAHHQDLLAEHVSLYIWFSASSMKPGDWDWWVFWGWVPDQISMKDDLNSNHFIKLVPKQ